MFSTLRTRFGIPGVISVIALVFAMFGGAYAASNSSGGGKATASAKAKKGPRGPKGATGPAGPAGPQGPAGANGKDGANGTQGAQGNPGTAGSPGTSVSAEEFSGTKEGHCIEGGTKFTAASTKTFACNGEAGTNGNPGAPGQPWTTGGTLPPSSAPGCPCTEKGVFSYGGAKGEYSLIGIPVPISFGIPLAAPLDSAHVVYVPVFEPNPDSTHCAGSVDTPTAASGYLCVYEGAPLGVTGPFIFPPSLAEPGAGESGAVLLYSVKPEAATTGTYVFGSWAVTG